jgi:F-box domain
MKLIDLKNNHFIEILQFLSLRDVSALAQVSKMFREFLRKYNNTVQDKFKKIMGLEGLDLVLNWNEILYNVYSDTSLSQCEFNPFYTNGGTYYYSFAYFIMNLVKDLTYCTILPQNVLIKYGFSPGIEYNYDQDPAIYRISENEYYLPQHDIAHENNPTACPYIEEVRIGVPKSGYTCPVETLMCFSSISKVDDLSLISNFHSIITKENAQNTGIQLKISNSLLETDQYEAILFDKSPYPIQPLCWVKCFYDEIYARITIKLQKSYFARYFYVLLINATKLSYQSNIDISSTFPLGKIIKLA